MHRTPQSQTTDTKPTPLGNPPNPALTPGDQKVGREPHPHVSIGSEGLDDEDKRYSNIACTD